MLLISLKMVEMMEMISIEVDSAEAVNETFGEASERLEARNIFVSGLLYSRL